MHTLEERFWSHVDVRGPDECWPWLGPTSTRNLGRKYGQFTVGNKAYTATHISVWLWRGEVLAPGLVMRHTCDNTMCVNPNHLLAGTQGENIQDSYDRGRRVLPRGERNPAAKLTLPDVIFVRYILGEGGTSQQQIANWFGVCQQTISRIKCNDAWKGILE